MSATPAVQPRASSQRDLPLVSIVVPVYNQADYVVDAIESVLAQDYPRVELITLDDGSTDATRSVLDRYAGRFHIESHSNMGQAATLTKGWALARGEILAYLSADDLLAPSAVRESVTELIAQRDAVATYCDFDLIDSKSRAIRRVTTPAYSYHDMLVTATCPPGPGAFFRRLAYDAAGPWNPKLSQMPDYDFWLRLGLQGRFVRIPRALSSFRIHETSQTYSRVSDERAREPVIIVRAILDRPDLPANIRAAAPRALANAHLVSAQLHLRAGRFAAGTRQLRAALGWSPAALFTPRALRLLANAAFNRLAHRAVSRLKDVLQRRSRRRGVG